ncbi:MAG TPA: methyltransferase domain-containing protein [Egibacteraceae bacterium]|nr:methyltransferase domain-containing protein [Egibacteraceae bacterium]
MTGASGFQLRAGGPASYERYNAVFMAPLVAALLERSGLGTGGALLDLACGPGLIARAAAAIVGPQGRLDGVDVNGPMIAHARAASSGTVPSITYHEAPAEALPLADAEFDAVLCQQGMQFFTDLDAAVAECARVLRPGGRLAATVWSALEESPYMQAHSLALARLEGPEEGAAVAAPFSFPPERLTAAFEQAGLRNVAVERVSPEVELPALEEFAPGHFAGVPWGRRTSADPVQTAKAVALMKEHLRRWTRPDGRVVVPFSSVLVSGVR